MRLAAESARAMQRKKTQSLPSSSDRSPADGSDHAGGPDVGRCSSTAESACRFAFLGVFFDLESRSSGQAGFNADVAFDATL
jgi:hypothetical protein